MRKVITLLMMCVAFAISAQEVDKATVTAQADAANATHIINKVITFLI